jgi:GT2 family glycosyltransferase
LACLQQKNQGAAAARNLGVSQAQGHVIIFLDSDVVPDPHLVEQHLASHNSVDQLVVGRVKTWSHKRPNWFEIASGADSSMDWGENERIIPFDMTLGGNLSVTRQIWDQVGKFDQEFPAAGCEETEWAYRATAQGYRLLYQPGAIGYHNHPRTLKQICQQQAAHMRSMALLVAKHPHLQTVIFGVDDVMPLWHAPRSARSVLRRASMKVYGLGLSRFVCYEMLSWLDRHRVFPCVASGLYWRLMDGWRYTGFREGMGLYAT